MTNMTLDEILTLARTQTGLPDPDLDTWREGLEILVRDHARTEVLSERGRGLLKARYTQALSARMRVDAYLREHPELTQVPVQRPVFILGMPRTGTTMVSYLLDADPRTRSLLKWEAYDGVPPAAAGALRTDPRCLAEKARDEQIIRANRARDKREALFAIDTELQPGINVITVVARESDDSATRTTMIVRRDGPNGEPLPSPKGESATEDWSISGDGD